jgi:energy-coupling factor transporter ATP-binding protein EcfA2
MLQLTDAGYRFPSCVEPSVRGVDLGVAPGEFVLLTGPTGSGKSTLLRLAAGLLGRHGSGEVSGGALRPGWFR